MPPSERSLTVAELPVTTLGDYGNLLPIGVLEGTPPALAKAFAFKPYRMAEEKEIGKVRRRKGGSGDHQGRLVTDVLMVMLTEWGGDTGFSSKSEKHQRNAIESAYMTDVLYAYICLRREAMGDIVGVKCECGRCGNDWTWEADLSRLDFAVVRSPDDLKDITYRLTSTVGFGDKKFDELVLTPPTWRAVTGHTGRADEGQIKAQLILSSVREVRSSKGGDSMQVALGGNLLDQITKRDIEEITNEINTAFPTIDLTMQIECPRCGHSWTNAVNWQYDFFFGSSSLPPRKRG